MIEVLLKEYEGVASSDVAFKEFYQMEQKKQEKIQVYSVQLKEALNRFYDHFFYGIKPELKASVWHLFDSCDVTFRKLLMVARRNELEEVDSKTTKLQSKAGIVEKKKWKLDKAEKTSEWVNSSYEGRKLSKEE